MDISIIVLIANTDPEFAKTFEAYYEYDPDTWLKYMDFDKVELYYEVVPKNYQSYTKLLNAIVNRYKVLMPLTKI